MIYARARTAGPGRDEITTIRLTTILHEKFLRSLQLERFRTRRAGLAGRVRVEGA
jgi:hypothetical protein